MKKILFSLFLSLSLIFLAKKSSLAVLGPSPLATVSPLPSYEATPSAKEATPASIISQVTTNKKDITIVTPEITDKFQRYLAEKPIAKLSLTNFLGHAVRSAIKMGVPANTIVLVLIFPLVATFIVATRHVVGIRGFGIFLPAVLSVVLSATGIVVGILMFLIIIIVATIGRLILKPLKLQYLPRMAMLLWFVCLGVLGALFGSPYLNLKALSLISIFSILILILLAQNFIDVQAGMSMREAISMTFETLLIALAGSLLLNLDFLQKFVLLYPEITVVGGAVLNVVIGKYVGLRLLEYKKFNELLKS